MKNLEELGISPTPWKNECDRIYPSVDDAQGFEVAELSDNDLVESNASLIAAAPELYEALREAIKFSCKSVNCAYADGGCKRIGCKFGKWREAISKASGEVNET